MQKLNFPPTRIGIALLAQVREGNMGYIFSIMFFSIVNIFITPVIAAGPVAIIRRTSLLFPVFTTFILTLLFHIYFLQASSRSNK